MATTLNDNIYVSGQKHVDGKRLRPNDTPWTSAEEVILSIEVGDRAESQEFYIVDKLWWFKGGVEDENLVEKLEGGTGELISKFTSTVIPTVDDSAIVIPANNTWLFDSVPYTNTVTNVLPFDYAAEGFSYFLTIVATKFNTFVAKVGGQSFSNPDEPIIDEENELFLTTYLIYDNYIDAIVPPVSPNIYVEKAFSEPQIYIGSVAVGTIGMGKKSTLVIAGTVPSVECVLKNNSNDYYIGQPFYTINKTPNPVKFTHLSVVIGSNPGSIGWYSPEEEDYYALPNEATLWVLDYIGAQKIHRRVSSYIDRDNVIYRSGTKTGKDIFGNLKFSMNAGLITEEFGGLQSRIYERNGKWRIEIDDGIDTPTFEFDAEKGLVASKLFEIYNDPNAYLQKGHIIQLEEDVFNLELNKANQATTYTKTEVDAKVTSVYKIRGSVANFASLPSSGQLEGDVWNLLDNGDNYAWVLDLNNTGLPGWDKLSGSVDLTAYETKVVAESKYLQITNASATVLSTLLTGISFATGGAIVSTDSVLVAFGKIQKQINDIVTALGLKQDTLSDTNFGTFTNSVADKNTQSDTDVLAYLDVLTGKWVKQPFSKLVDYFKGFFQTKTQLITTATTATNGSKYIAVGTFTVSDFSAVQGNWYEVFIRNGTITIDGIAYKDGLIKRIFDTTWKSYWFPDVKKLLTNLAVSGTFTIDPTIADSYVLELVGNTTLAKANFPTTYARQATGVVTGNFGMSYTGMTVVGVYSPTRKNRFAIEVLGGSTVLTWMNYD